MKYGINTLDDFDFKDKTVLCRLDLNSPYDSKNDCLKDITRIDKDYKEEKITKETHTELIAYKTEIYTFKTTIIDKQIQILKKVGE